jgi:hypothetical protein
LCGKDDQLVRAFPFDTRGETECVHLSVAIEKVFVYDDSVIAVAMYPDFGMVLGMPKAAPNRVLETLSENKNGYKLNLYP